MHIFCICRQAQQCLFLRKARIFHRAINGRVCNIRRRRDIFSYQEKVRQAYLEMAKAEPERYVVIDATLSREEIFEIIKNELVKRGVIEC